MKLQQRQPQVFPNASSSPRFSGVESNIIERNLYPYAAGFLSMSQKADSYFTQNFLHDKAGVFRRLIGTIFGPIATVLGKHDYHEMARLAIPKVADFGRIVVEPPKGALVVLLFGFTLMGRLSHAAKRAIGGDRRELRDIFFRDIPTFAIILFALDPIMKKLSMFLEKRNGIQLIKPGVYKPGVGMFNNFLKRIGAFHTAEAFTYSQLEDVYRLSSKTKLSAVLANSVNHKGVLQAIDNTMSNGNLSNAMINTLKRFRHHVAQALKSASSGGSMAATLKNTVFNTHVGEAFGYLGKLNTLRDEWVKETLRRSGGAAGPSFLMKWIRSYTSNVPAFKDMFLAYAKNSRVWSNVAAYGIQIAILGIGIPLFNKWYTEREFARQQQQQAGLHS